MAFEKNKLPIWNLAGSLNELDPPSEVPIPDVIQVSNWKPDKDGKSRIKRPGYSKIDAAFASFNKPIRGIFKYIDPNDEEKIIIVTRDSIVLREDVYTWTRKYLDADGFYNLGYRTPFLYQDKLCIIDHGPTATKIQILQTSDGDAWSALANGTPPVGPSSSHGNAAGVYADEIFYGMPAPWTGDMLISRYDGAFNYELASPKDAESTLRFHKWDGKLWILIYRTGGYLVYYYDGAAYSQIANYGGVAELPTNSSQIFVSGIKNRMARFFTWNNNLYLLVTIKNSISGNWTWQIWEFNPTLYDRFTLLYDHSGVDDNYGACSLFEYDGKLWIISQKLFLGVADAYPVGNDNIIYSSSNLTTWTEVKSGMALGCVFGEIVFGGKVFINTLYNWTTTRSSHIFSWDKVISEFISEYNITTNAAPAANGSGGLIEFLGELYVGKYMEVYKRILSTNTYTEIYSTSKEISMPVASAFLDDGRLIFGLSQLVEIEGDNAYSLGIEAPVQAPDLAVDGLIVIGAANNKINFEETAGVELTATLGAGSYSPAAMCTEIKAQLDAAGASTYTVIYNSDNAFQIDSDGAGGAGIFNILSATGSTTTPAHSDLGLSTNFDYTGALSYTANPWALTGYYKYVVTFYRSGNYPCESNPSPETIQIKANGEKIDLSNIPVSPDPKCDTRRIYRTTDGGENFYWLDDIDDNSTTTYEDRIDDNTLLGGDEVSYDRYPPPVGKYMETWDNRLWIAGVEGYPNYLYHTNLGTSEEMAAGNFIPIKAREADIIKQIKVFGDRLYVFKGSSRFMVSKVGSSLYEVEQLPENIGTDSPWSVAVCDKFMIWKSDFGIEVFNGNSCFRPIVSDLVKVTMASINIDALDKIVAGHNFAEGEYWLSVPTGSATEPNKVIVYHYLRRWFTVYDFPEGLTYLMSTKTRAKGLMFLTGTEDGNVVIQGSGYNDDSVVISSHFWTGWWNVSNEKELYNVLRRMFLKYQVPENMTLTLDIYADFSKTAIVTLTFNGNTPTDNVPLRKDILARKNLRIPGYYVSFKFTNNEDTGGEVKVCGFDLYFTKNLWRYSVEGD